MPYEFDIDQCDVVDRAKLEAFRSKREEWLGWMHEDPHHAVCTQIAGMLWNDAVFRMVNEARRLAHKRHPDATPMNDALMRLLDEGFVATQVLAIRRLREREANQDRNQVISLKRTLDDIRAHASLFTREVYICFDGLPYDPALGLKVHRDRAAARPSGVVVESLATSGPDAWSTSFQLHEAFDRMSGTTPTTRSRDDTIRPEVLAFIDDQLEGGGWKGISEFANKFVAHAADPHSRSLVQPPRLGVSLNDLERCHKSICQAASVILSTILYDSSYGFFPVPQYDVLEHLERQLVDPVDMETIERMWNENIERVENWGGLDLSHVP